MNHRFGRQSFLGERAEQILMGSTVGIVGLGGGGSHVAQQLAHVGIGKLLLFDPDHVEPSNLNRLIGATDADAGNGTSKVEVAYRLISGVNPKIEVSLNPVKWQLAATVLREADVIISCVDTYAAREDLEVSTRRFLTPLVDIGMDVHQVGRSTSITGQVILSTPGGPCLRCLGFLTEDNLRQEAQLYGAAGSRPQVVWANGVLASIAVGIVVNLLTGWQPRKQRGEYLHYDGNEHFVSRSARIEYAPKECPHFSANDLGEPTL